MGLDMYLRASKYVGNYRHSENSEKAAYGKVLGAIGLDAGKVSPDCHSLIVTVPVLYWRKANAIHGWFVKNCQGGRDECQETFVDREKLEELRQLCEKSLASRCSKDLAPVGGFFFGSTEEDEYYWEDLKRTADGLRGLLEDETFKDFDFYYQASW